MNDRPKNLYDLCDQVCESIAARPQNYMQQRWASTDPQRTLEIECGVDTAKRLTSQHEMCGTAYCRAGWMMSILYDGPVDEDINIDRRAHILLEEAGVPGPEVVSLFVGSQAGLLNTWGTPEYVQRGIDGMRKFMDRHEQKLKNARLVYGKKPGDVRVLVEAGG